MMPMCIGFRLESVDTTMSCVGVVIGASLGLKGGQFCRRQQLAREPLTERLPGRLVRRHFTVENAFREIADERGLPRVPERVRRHADAWWLPLGIAELAGDAAQVAGDVNLGCVSGDHPENRLCLLLEPFGIAVGVGVAVEENSN